MMTSLLARCDFLHPKKNKEMTTNLLAHHHLLHLRKKPRNDEEAFDLLSFSTTKKNVGNDNELGGSLLSSVTKAKQPKMMNRDLGLLLFSALEEKNQEMMMSLPICCCLLHLKKKCRK